jgi:hypothetical protein
MPGANASGAEIKPYSYAVDRDGSGLNIGHPGTAGMLLGMAHPVSKTERFTAIITSDSQL